MRFRTGNCCCRADYTTARYERATGNRLWTANYFQDATSTQWSGKATTAQQTDSSNVYVGGMRVYNGTKYWNVVAFNKSTGAYLWDRDTYVDAGSPATAVGSNLNRYLYHVTQIQIDPDGNVVVMLDSRYDTHAHFVVLDTSGNFVAHRTFTTGAATNVSTLYPQGFTIDSSGNYHILAKYGSPTSVSGYFYTYKWTSPFGGAPTLNDIPAGAGTDVPFLASSIVRFGNRDYIGGYALQSTFDVLQQPLAPTALRGKSQTNPPSQWSDFDLHIPKHISLTTATITGSGTTQAAAAVLTANRNYLASNPGPGTGSALKLPEGPSVGDTVVIRATDIVRVFPHYGGNIQIYNRYIAATDQEVFCPKSFVDSSVYYTNSIFVYTGNEIWHGYFIDGNSTTTTVRFAALLPYEAPDGSIVAANEYMSTQPIYGSNYAVGGEVLKYDSSGNLTGWLGCYKVHSAVDDSGNVFAFGPRGRGVGVYPPPGVVHTTLEAWNSSGTRLWGHNHAGSNTKNAQMMHIDGDDLIVTGYNDDQTGGRSLGPMVAAFDQDFVSDPCPPGEPNPPCTGSCEFAAANETTTTTEYAGPRTLIITATQNCRMDFEVLGGSGGGGGSQTFGQGGGGGERPAVVSFAMLVPSGQFLRFEMGGAGTAGDWSGTVDGGNGGDIDIYDSDGDSIGHANGGHGGKADGTGGTTGGGGGGTAGQTSTGFDGGNGANTHGAYGKGGVYLTSTAPTDGDNSSLANAGGGGGAYSIPLSPVIGDGIGAAGSTSFVKVTITTWEWQRTGTPDDCSTDCGCLTADEVTAIYGSPFRSTDTISVNCVI